MAVMERQTVLKQWPTATDSRPSVRRAKRAAVESNAVWTDTGGASDAIFEQVIVDLGSRKEAAEEGIFLE